MRADGVDEQVCPAGYGPAMPGEPTASIPVDDAASWPHTLRVMARTLEG
jgi:hypothetical protein